MIYFLNITFNCFFINSVSIRGIQDNKEIIITKPDKGAAILDQKLYEKCMYEIINDGRKFKRLQRDVTLQRENQLQRFLRKLKKDGFLSDNIYNEIYPSGSLPARIYGLPKLHKLSPNHPTLKVRPIVSSISTYNYNLAKYLCSLLSDVPSTYSSQDLFTFVK